MKYPVLLSALAILATGKAHAQKSRITGPHLIVYKTRGNYNDLVPVTLSEDGKTISNYPGVADIKARSNNSAPVKLHKKYLLDVQGAINPHVAFLKTTYSQYARLSETPSVEQLQNMIKVTDPLTTLCDCGPRSTFKDPVKDINRLIDNGTLLKKCKAMTK